MTIHFLRHATFILKIDNTKILIDPMLSVKDAMDPVKNASNEFRIPMVDLPLTHEQLLAELKTIDAVIVSHTHRDHWDPEAQSLLPKDIPLIIQPSDSESIGKQGFTNLLPVEDSIMFRNIKITRTGGQHGTGEIGARMGKVSGFVLQHGARKLYVAGDTIWCSEVEQALAAHRPDYIVLNAGAAQFLQGGPITMNAEDVMKVCSHTTKSKVVAVHMNTVNHCLLKRDDLMKAIKNNNLADQCLIPNDGDTINL